MAVIVEISNDQGWTQRAHFEVVPRQGEIVHWPNGDGSITDLEVVRVGYHFFDGEFQAQLHVRQA